MRFVGGLLDLAGAVVRQRGRTSGFLSNEEAAGGLPPPTFRRACCGGRRGGRMCFAVIFDSSLSARCSSIWRFVPQQIELKRVPVSRPRCLSAAETRPTAPSTKAGDSMRLVRRMLAISGPAETKRRAAAHHGATAVASEPVRHHRLAYVGPIRPGRGRRGEGKSLANSAVIFGSLRLPGGLPQAGGGVNGSRGVADPTIWKAVCGSARGVTM